MLRWGRAINNTSPLILKFTSDIKPSSPFQGRSTRRNGGHWNSNWGSQGQELHFLELVVFFVLRSRSAF